MTAAHLPEREVEEHGGRGWIRTPGAINPGQKIEFYEHIRPGDTITGKGVISEKHPRQKGESFVVMDLSAENQRGDMVAVATARVILR